MRKVKIMAGGKVLKVIEDPEDQEVRDKHQWPWLLIPKLDSRGAATEHKPIWLSTQASWASNSTAALEGSQVLRNITPRKQAKSMWDTKKVKSSNLHAFQVNPSTQIHCKLSFTLICETQPTAGFAAAVTWTPLPQTALCLYWGHLTVALIEAWSYAPEPKTWHWSRYSAGCLLLACSLGSWSDKFQSPPFIWCSWWNER